MGEMSLCSLAMLALIVDRETTSVDTLIKSVPPGRPGGRFGEAVLPDEWPSDVVEWFEDLQVLLDRELVERVAAEGGYEYRTTGAGVRYLRAWLHPAGVAMRSVA